MEPLIANDWLQDNNLDGLFDLFEQEMELRDESSYSQANSNCAVATTAESILGTTPITSHLFGTSPLFSALDLHDLLMFDQNSATTNAAPATSTSNPSTSTTLSTSTTTSTCVGLNKTSINNDNLKLTASISDGANSCSSTCSSNSNESNSNSCDTNLSITCQGNQNTKNIINMNKFGCKFNSNVNSHTNNDNCVVLENKRNHAQLDNKSSIITSPALKNGCSKEMNKYNHHHHHQHYQKNNHDYAATQIDNNKLLTISTNVSKKSTNLADQHVSATDSLTSSFNNAMKFKKKTKKRQSEGISLLARPKTDSTNSASSINNGFNNKYFSNGSSDNRSALQSQVKLGVLINNHNIFNGIIRNVKNVQGFAVVREHAYALSMIN